METGLTIEMFYQSFDREPMSSAVDEKLGMFLQIFAQY